MEDVLKVISEMYKEGIIQNYAIGGAIATMFYTEPFLTYDVDIFFIPPQEDKIILLTPFYDWLLRKKGYKTYKEYIMIGNTPVQFIPATTELEKEAVKNAIKVKYKGANVKILKPEYLIAISLQVFRRKDKEKIIKLLEETKIDKNLLMRILERYDLKKKFKDFIKKYYE